MAFSFIIPTKLHKNIKEINYFFFLKKKQDLFLRKVDQNFLPQLTIYYKHYLVHTKGILFFSIIYNIRTIKR